MKAQKRLLLAAGAEEPAEALRLAEEAVVALRLEVIRWQSLPNVVGVLARSESPLSTRQVAHYLGLAPTDTRKLLVIAHTAGSVRRFGIGPATSWALRRRTAIVQGLPA